MNQKNKKLINQKQFLRLKQDYEEAKIHNPKKFISIKMKKKISIKKSEAFEKIKEFIFNNVTIEDVFVGLIIMKNKNQAFVKEFQENKNISYVVKFGKQYVEFSFQIINHENGGCEVEVVKNFVHSKKLSLWSKMLVKNQAKSEMESIFKFLNKKEKKQSE